MNTYTDVQEAVREVYFRLTPHGKNMRMIDFHMRVESILGHDVDSSLLKLAMNDLKIKTIKGPNPGLFPKKNRLIAYRQ